MTTMAPALLALHVIGCVGFVVIVSMGKITAPVRKIWPAMMSCSMCFGIWGGMGWALALLARPSLPVWMADVHDAIAFACVASCLGFIVSLADAMVGAVGKIRGREDH